MISILERRAGLGKYMEDVPPRRRAQWLVPWQGMARAEEL